MKTGDHDGPRKEEEAGGPFIIDLSGDERSRFGQGVGETNEKLFPDRNGTGGKCRLQRLVV
jgi:hypothetical protein